MSDEFKTKGEAMLERSLEKEEVAGVPHYKPGQHRAVIVADDAHLTAVLSFVNGMGTAIKMLCRRGEGAWEPLTASTVRRSGVMVDWGTTPLPDDVKLTPGMVNALRQAEQEYLEAFSADR